MDKRLLTETTATFIHSVPRSTDITATADTELKEHTNTHKIARYGLYLCRTIIYNTKGIKTLDTN